MKCRALEVCGPQSSQSTGWDHTEPPFGLPHLTFWSCWWSLDSHTKEFEIYDGGNPINLDSEKVVEILYNPNNFHMRKPKTTAGI